MTKRERTYNQILSHGIGIISRESLGAVTIGRVAEVCKMSRTGVISHFKNKEDMQVAILERIRWEFIEQVILKARDKHALVSLEKFLRIWCDWVVKAGYGMKVSCPILKATAEYQDLPNDRVKLAIKRLQLELLEFITKQVDWCIRKKLLPSEVDSEQISYEILSLYQGRNLQKGLLGKGPADKKFWRAINRLLGQQWSADGDK